MDSFTRDLLLDNPGVPFFVGVMIMGLFSVVGEAVANKTGNDDWLKGGVTLGTMLGVIVACAIVLMPKGEY